MKIKDGFTICKVGDSNIVMSVGSTMHMEGLTTLNETGAFIWQMLQKDTEETALVQAVCAEFDVDLQAAQEDVHTFVQTLRKAGFLV